MSRKVDLGTSDHNSLYYLQCHLHTKSHHDRTSFFLDPGEPPPFSPKFLTLFCRLRTSFLSTKGLSIPCSLSFFRLSFYTLLRIFSFLCTTPLMLIKSKRPGIHYPYRFIPNLYVLYPILPMTSRC